MGIETEPPKVEAEEKPEPQEPEEPAPIVDQIRPDDTDDKTNETILEDKPAIALNGDEGLLQSNQTSVNGPSISNGEKTPEITTASSKSFVSDPKPREKVLIS